MTKRLLSFVAVVAILSSLAFGQTSGKIVGTVYDVSQEAPLGFTNVVVQGTSLGAVSDEDGRYVILDVPPGVYTIVCTYIGYSPMEIQELAVISGLTTIQDIQMQTEDVVGEVVTVIAEKPLINMNATNTTRVVDAELIENMAVRGVQNVVAMQTGVVAHDGEIHIRGSRYQDVAYYVDGVYMNDAFDMRNTSNVSNVAMGEMKLQTGGFSAQYGNANGGVVSTSTRTGGEKMSLDVEFIQGLGASGDGTEDKLYSLGYRLYNVNVGGALGSKIRYFMNYENRTTDDPRPSNAPHYSMDRDEIMIEWDSIHVEYNEEEQRDYASGELWVDGQYVGDIENDLHSILESTLEDMLTEYYAEQGVDYDLIDAVVLASTEDDHKYGINGYSNFQELYGARKNVGSVRNTFAGNVMFDLKPFKIKVGGNMNAIESHGYTNIDYATTLLNSDYNRKRTSLQTSLYTNLTWVLSTKSYLTAKLSLYNYKEEMGDDHHWDNVLGYGDPSDPYNRYMSAVGQNPLSVADLADYLSYGRVWDDYSKQFTSYTGITVDYLNQINEHELTAGFEYRDNTIKYYRVAQPIELAEGFDIGPDSVLTDQQVYEIYRNAYTENFGFDLFGEEDEDGQEWQDPGEPTIFGAYINDKIELKDLVVNLGLRYEYFNPNTQAPEDWYDIRMTNGRIDRDSSRYVDVDADVQLNPRIGFSFPVTDKTKFHAQYGKFSQHPLLNRLYLSDVVFANNFKSGNYTRSPNAKLRSEKTTQYEVGFSQVMGENVAIDVTGFYKEIRDYTLIKNLFGAQLDQSDFVWAQYQNGDYGVVKGISFGLGMNRVGGLMANLSYTAQWAEGTGSDPESNYYVAWQSDQGEAGFPSLINPLDYDQRHTGNLMLDYRLQQDLGMFSNTGVNMVYTFGSGTAYTPSAIESSLFGRGEIYPTSPINSGYTPWTSNLDIRLDSGVKLGSVDMTIYLLVQNALNAKNVITVYSGTGDAGTDGWLNSDPGKSYLSGNANNEDYYLSQVRDPANWDKPRSVQLGVKLNLLSGENN